jgi:hypothetical protein
MQSAYRGYCSIVIRATQIYNQAAAEGSAGNWQHTPPITPMLRILDYSEVLP